MKKVLITGASGFTGQHMIGFLQGFPDLEIVGADLKPVKIIRAYQTDLLDLQKTVVLVGEEKPDYIIHLAGINRAEDFRLFYQYNLFTAVNILEAVNRHKLYETRLLFISSSAVYGRVKDNPVAESAPTAPVNFYGSSKLAMENAVLQYFYNFSLKVHIVRPFNLIGPGQETSFVVPYFTETISAFSSGAGPYLLKTKSLSSARDFVDVRDAVQAYWRVLTGGQPGAVYNVASGRTIVIRDLLALIIEKVGLKDKITIEESSVQTGEIAVISGDIKKIRKLKWTAKTDLKQSLADIIAACKQK